MITVALLSWVFLGIVASLGLAVLVGCLLAFGEDRLEIEADQLTERWLIGRPPG
jgi:hypothetical protein